MALRNTVAVSTTTRNTVQITDSGLVKVVSVGVQGPAGTSVFTPLGKSIENATASGNELLQYKANTNQWEGVTSPAGLTIDAGTY